MRFPFNADCGTRFNDSPLLRGNPPVNMESSGVKILMLMGSDSDREVT